MEDVLFFIIGITLIGIEIFITPGLGFLGVGGLLLMLASLINAMVKDYLVHGSPFHGISKLLPLP